MKDFNRKHLALILLVVMVIVMLPIHVFAEGNQPIDVECQLNINYNYGDTPISDAKFHVYKVGEVYMNGSAELTGDFAGLDIDLGDADQLKMAGVTMYNFVSEKGIQPDYEVVTNEKGKANLVALDAGIYLVVGQPRIEGDDGYFTDPQVIFFPHNPGLESEYWNSNITINPKATVRCILDPLVYTAKKTWVDKGAESLRPDSIVVRLYENGVEYDSVKLSKDNNWSYVWKDLNPKSEWTLKEDVVLDYRADITLENDTFIVKNTFEGELPSDETIDQTGLLWWPVPLMAFVGMVFVILGMFITRKEKYEE